MENILQETKFIMDKYHIKANKSLGQNFLISEEVIKTIVDCSNITKEDLVIEIGPGLGTLTKDLKNIIQQEKSKNQIKKVKVVANLPYYITTPIIMKLLEEELELDTITVMIQKEVANRLIAIPGDKEAGGITYSVYYYAEAEAIIEVPKDSFLPEPEVTSKVIKLKIRKEPPVKIERKEILFRIIKCAFMQRRKTLLNALVNTKVFINKEQGEQILKKLNLPITIRPENLSLQDYANITKLAFPLKS